MAIKAKPFKKEVYMGIIRQYCIYQEVYGNSKDPTHEQRGVRQPDPGGTYLKDRL